MRFQHTAARRRLVKSCKAMSARRQFQHTAARRRLATFLPTTNGMLRFNTQPPEGGWPPVLAILCLLAGFQHTAARRRLENKNIKPVIKVQFQHTAARRRLVGRAIIVTSCFSFNTQPPEGGWLNLCRLLLR